MANIKSFKGLIVWQKAHQLTIFVYRITQTFPDTERFGIISQLRRAAVSIAANIAEGFHRYTIHDSLHFYTIAQGSLEETRYYCILVHDLGYITSDQYQQLENLISEASKLLTAWIQSQRDSVQ